MSQPTQTAPEEMASFFDARFDGYEDHMRRTFEGKLEEFYARVAAPIPETNAAIHILDLGCGTGLELEYIFRKAPHTMVTGIDMSPNMLALLKQKYARYAAQLDIRRGSYLDIPFQPDTYDYVVSVMTMHHWLEEPKLELYQRIRTALKNGGSYIEGDYVVDAEEERQKLQSYHEQMTRLDANASYHLDIPFTVQRQEDIFRRAGFVAVQTRYYFSHVAIFMVQK